jgi:hypothetical protein
MFGTIVRVALLRVLPRKLLPILTAWQIISMLRSRNKRADDAGSRPANHRR